MTADTPPQFSAATVDAILAEANALHLKGATAITVALRNQLTLMKSSGAVPDKRTQTYYVVGRVVIHGQGEALEGVADIEGLASLNGLARDVVLAYFDVPAEAVPADLVEGQLKSARVNLARKGEAHLQVIYETDDAGKPLSWVDLWVYLDPHTATASAIPTGKLF